MLNQDLLEFWSKKYVFLISSDNSYVANLLLDRSLGLVVKMSKANLKAKLTKSLTKGLLINRLHQSSSN